MKSFELGEAVLFCNMWGDTYNTEKQWRWGELRAGFITAIEYIEARDSTLYTVGITDSVQKTEVHTKMLGEHLIFKLNEKTAAWLTLQQYCEEC